jgi:capsular exopolysaccharide synthesis family protein
MSSTLGLHTTNLPRLSDEAVSRSHMGRRTFTLQPGKKSRLVFLTEPQGLAVEQYKILRNRLSKLRPDGGVLLITSPSPGEGKTLTAVNLAWCLAEAGDHVCLVDLDFRAPGVAAALGCTFDEDGIEDVLTGKRSISDSIRQIGKRSLYVLGVKKNLPSPGRFLTPEVLSPVLSDLQAMFQWVILDFAPIIPMADVSEVVPLVDGALMVVRAGKTEKGMVAPSLEALGSKLLGVILNDSPISGSSYYGYYGKHRERD